jgi:hypothetical protein
VISGGIIVQSLLDENWDNSDVDVYVCEEYFEVFLQRLEKLKQLIIVIDAPNYHNSFMNKNNIRFLATTKMPIGPPFTTINGRDMLDLTDTNTNPTVQYIVEHDTCPLVSSFVYDAEKKLYATVNYFNQDADDYDINEGLFLQVICVKAGVPLRSVIGSFDLTFCQVLFDGEHFETCGETTMADVLAKRGRLADDYYQMYNHTLHKRIIKYLARNFTIDIDWSKINYDINTSMTENEMLIQMFKQMNLGYNRHLLLTSSRCRNIADKISIVKVHFHITTNHTCMLPSWNNYRHLIPAYIASLRLTPKYQAILEELLNFLAEYRIVDRDADEEVKPDIVRYFVEKPISVCCTL